MLGMKIESQLPYQIIIQGGKCYSWCGTFTHLKLPRDQRSSLLVSQNEREDRILHEVIECMTCQLVQFHQILQVNNVFLLPTTHTHTHRHTHTHVNTHTKNRHKDRDYQSHSLPPPLPPPPPSPLRNLS